MTLKRSYAAALSLAVLGLVSAPFALHLVYPFSDAAQADGPTTLSIQKTVTESVTTPGADLHYRVTVTNTGSQPTVNAYIEDYLHPNMLVSGTLPGACSVVTFTNGATGIRCHIGTLAPAASAYRDFVIKTSNSYACGNGSVARNSAGAYAQNSNSVTTPVIITQVNCTGGSSSSSSSLSSSSSSSSVSSSSSTIGGATVLAITKTVTEPQTVPGGQLSYTVEIRNNGAVTANQVYIDDYLHPGMQAVSFPAGCGIVTFENGSQAVRCMIGTVQPSQSIAGVFVFRVVPGYPCNNGSVARNSAAVFAQNAASAGTPVIVTPVLCASSSSSSISSSSSSYNPCTAYPALCSSSSSSVSSGSPTLSLEKTVTQAQTTPGAILNYRLTVRNIGSAAANQAYVDDYIQPGMFVATFPAGCGLVTFSNGAEGVRCSLGTFAANQTVTFDFTFRTSNTYPCNNGSVARNSAGVYAQNANGVTTPVIVTPVLCASSSSSSLSSSSSSSSYNPCAIYPTLCSSPSSSSSVSSSSSSSAQTSTTLTITKTTQNIFTHPGQNIPYVLTVRNAGSVTASQAYVDDYLHPNMFAVGPLPAQCGMITFPNGAEGIRCFIGNLAPGTEATRTLVIRTGSNYACNNGSVARNAAGAWAQNASAVTTPIIVTPVHCPVISSSSSSSSLSSSSSSSSYNPCAIYPTLCSSSSSLSSSSVSSPGSSSASSVQMSTTLTVEKTVAEANTTPGANLHYRLRVRNAGSVTASQAYVDDYIHPGMLVVQMDSQCGLVTYPNGAVGVRCFLGNLAAGQTAEKNLIFRTANDYLCGNGSVARNAAGAWAQNANGVTTPLIVTPVLCTGGSSSSSVSTSSSVSSSSSSYNPCVIYPWLCSSSSSSVSSSSSSRTTIAVSKIVAEAQTVPGGLLNYRVFVQNTGNATAVNVVFDDYIHPNMIAHSFPAGCGIVQYANGGTGVRCALGNLAPGQTVHRDLVFRTANNYLCGNGAVARNSAGAWADNANGVTTALIITPVNCASSSSSSSSSIHPCTLYPWLCSSSSSSSSYVHPCIQYPWLCYSSSSSYGNERFRLVKKASVSDVFPGGVIEYTVRIENDTNRDLTNVILTDEFDDRDLVIVDDGDADDEDDGELRWNLGTLRRGDEEVVRYRLRVRNSVYPGTRVRNDALVRTNEGFTDRDSVTVNVIGMLPQTGAFSRLTGGTLQPLTGARESGLPFATLLTLALTGLSGGLWLGKKFLLP